MPSRILSNSATNRLVSRLNPCAGSKYHLHESPGEVPGPPYRQDRPALAVDLDEVGQVHVPVLGHYRELALGLLARERQDPPHLVDLPRGDLGDGLADGLHPLVPLRADELHRVDQVGVHHARASSPLAPIASRLVARMMCPPLGWRGGASSPRGGDFGALPPTLETCP